MILYFFFFTQLLLLLATLEADHWTPLSDNLLCWLSCVQAALLPLCMYSSDRPFRAAVRLALRRRSPSLPSFGGHFRFAKFTGLNTLRPATADPSSHPYNGSVASKHSVNATAAALYASANPNGYNGSMYSFSGTQPGMFVKQPLPTSNHLLTNSALGGSRVRLGNMEVVSEVNNFKSAMAAGYRPKLSRHNSTQPLYAPLPRHQRPGERCSYAAGDRCSFAQAEPLSAKCGLHRQSTFSFMSAQFPGYSTLSEQERKTRRSWLEPTVTTFERLASKPVAHANPKPNLNPAFAAQQLLVANCVPFEHQLQVPGMPISRCNPVYLTNEHFLPTKRLSSNQQTAAAASVTTSNSVVETHLHNDHHKHVESGSFDSLDNSLECPLIRKKTPDSDFETLQASSRAQAAQVRQETKESKKKHFSMLSKPGDSYRGDKEESDTTPLQLWTLSLKPVEGANRFYGDLSEDSIQIEAPMLQKAADAANVLLDDQRPLPSLLLENVLRNHNNILELSIFRDEEENDGNENREGQPNGVGSRSTDMETVAVEGGIELEADQDDDDCNGLIKKRRSFASFGRADCESICDLAFTTNANDDFEFLTGQSDPSDDGDDEVSTGSTENTESSEEDYPQIDLRANALARSKMAAADSIDSLTEPSSRRISSGFGSGGSSGTSPNVESVDWGQQRLMADVEIPGKKMINKVATQSEQLDLLRCSSQERLLSPSKKALSEHNLTKVPETQLPVSVTLLLSMMQNNGKGATVNDGRNALTQLQQNEKSGLERNKLSSPKRDKKSKESARSIKNGLTVEKNSSKNKSSKPGETFFIHKETNSSSSTAAKTRIDSSTITKGSSRNGLLKALSTSERMSVQQASPFSSKRQTPSMASDSNSVASRPMYRKRNDKNRRNELDQSIRSEAIQQINQLPVRSSSARIANIGEEEQMSFSYRTKLIGSSANHSSQWLLLPAAPRQSPQLMHRLQAKKQPSPNHWPVRQTAIGQLQPLRGLSGRCSSSGNLLMFGRSLMMQNAKSLPDLTEDCIVNSCRNSALFPYNFT